MADEKQFRIEELGELSGITPRNIRYYIQEGLVDKPQGERRGAWYTTQHLQQLLTIKRLREEEGISLDKIKSRWRNGLPDSTPAVIDMPGTQRVWQSITLAPGLELNLCPEMNGITQDELGAIYRAIQHELTKIQRNRQEKSK
ncbi:MAG: MerR family transcriptional regulator [Gammaproteobacteria bacterium]|nr:MerR family transcriptional regulator [Gammaproteobacteria bacterium]MDH5653273.1 MerR family transcriptional regulator [Gammaproteobacteria bacterium]